MDLISNVYTLLMHTHALKSSSAPSHNASAVLIEWNMFLSRSQMFFSARQCSVASSSSCVTFLFLKVQRPDNGPIEKKTSFRGILFVRSTLFTMTLIFHPNFILILVRFFEAAQIVWQGCVVPRWLFNCAFLLQVPLVSVLKPCRLVVRYL